MKHTPSPKILADHVWRLECPKGTELMPVLAEDYNPTDYKPKFKTVPVYSQEDLVQGGHYPAYCPDCKWQGLSLECTGGEELADTGDYTDVTCPLCNFPVEEDDQYVLNTR